MSSSLSQDTVLDALRNVTEPVLEQNVVDLGMIKNLKISGGAVAFTLELMATAYPHKRGLAEACAQAVNGLDGVTDVQLTLTAVTISRPLANQELLPDVKNVVAVASGKGGVGKSTTAANLAVALSQTGAQVGLMDADIYGPSIPLMFGVQGQPNAVGGKIQPIERQGLKLMSMGFLANENTPVIWRGPMVHGVVKQFMSDVNWGVLDYLVVDMPPGTGDAQLTLTQNPPLAGAVIVTTPQDVALIDARKGLLMFKQVNVPVLGIVENMSFFACPHCGKETDIFDRGGGERTATELDVPFLGAIPIDAQVRVDGDAGLPVVAAHPDSAVAEAYRVLAGNVAVELIKLNYGQQAFTM